MTTRASSLVPHLLSLAVSTALGVVIFVDRDDDWTGFDTWGLPACALVYLVVALARGVARRPAVLALQAAGLVLFGAVAVVALALDPEVGRYVVAGGWVAHAAWDLAHFRARLVVPRWYALACVVVDTFVGVSLVW